MNDEKILLTQYSRGAGCGCKISPQVLDAILKQNAPGFFSKDLLVGFDTKDDAAVYDLGNGTALISTTDFFMPVVDDATDFGRIAAANSISDVYAMGGKPIMAIAILGWPVEKLSADLAQQVLAGARIVCTEAGISLAGGHSIDSVEPFFGLAVTGIVPIEQLKRNSTSRLGDMLFLTKPLGTGILSTAQKRGLLAEDHYTSMISSLSSLNKIGELLGQFDGVTAMTDVTGFGLLGHAVEMAEGSQRSIELYYSEIKLLAGVKEYIGQRIFPDATTRNWSSFSSKISFAKGINVMEAFTLLPDPQTNGGLLVSVAPESTGDITGLFQKHGLENHLVPIGRFVQRGEKTISVLP